MKELLTEKMSGHGIVTLISWDDFKKNSSNLFPEAILWGIRSFSDQAGDPLEIVEVITTHPKKRTIVSLLNNYGELQAGYLVNVLVLSLSKKYITKKDCIAACNFKKIAEIIRLNEELLNSKLAS